VNAPLGEADLTDAPDWLYALMEKPILSKPPLSAKEAKAISLRPAPTDDPHIDRKQAYAMAALEREAEAVASSAEGVATTGSMWLRMPSEISSEKRSSLRWRSGKR